MPENENPAANAPQPEPERPVSPTRAALEHGIRNATKRIGRAIAEGASQNKLARLRQKRGALMMALAVCYRRYSLVNGEGMTEFVDKDEYEQRVVAWARRRGLIPRVPMRGANMATPPPPPTDQQPPGAVGPNPD
jgi:hypothetical protein